MNLPTLDFSVKTQLFLRRIKYPVLILVRKCRFCVDGFNGRVQHRLTGNSKVYTNVVYGQIGQQVRRQIK